MKINAINSCVCYLCSVPLTSKKNNKKKTTKTFHYVDFLEKDHYEMQLTVVYVIFVLYFLPPKNNKKKNN